MTTEKHDPWALLREARNSVLRDSRYAGVFGDNAEIGRHLPILLDLLSRIDAALAEHEAEERVDSATPVVEWCVVRDTWATAYPVDGVEMTVMRWVDGPWKWWTKIETSAHGIASTEAEAKTAAIAAARGMR